MSSKYLIDEVKDKIKDKVFNIYQEEDDFNLDDLIHLKNKIHIKNENVNKKKVDNSEEMQLKYKILICFQNLISNLEIINEHLKVLRTKGSSLPIKISIKTKIINEELSIQYYLDDKENNFEFIRNFLFKAKNNYISQLNSLYKQQLNLRYFYGKQFRNIMKHLENNLNIDSFLRYILNNKDNNKPIKEGYKAITRNCLDYINYFELYNKNSLESISKYITTVFRENGITFEEHFNKMEIKFKDGKLKRHDCNNNFLLEEDHIIYNNNCKGIYLHECENNSMERYIINLYWDKLGELPISQNILIANKETSPEEIQSFLYRAILCNYNILFIVEINDSFSDYQQYILNSYISNSLLVKYNNFKEQTKDDFNQKNTGIYLDSCIVFIYDKQNYNIRSFLNGIKKYKIQDISCNAIIDDKNDKFISDLGNILVITSDICGLGKSEKIRKIIKDENKKYFYFS